MAVSLMTPVHRARADARVVAVDAGRIELAARTDGRIRMTTTTWSLTSWWCLPTSLTLTIGARSGLPG
jgi:hypothetical protein